MPVETNIICEQCGRYADSRTYVQLQVKENPAAALSSKFYFTPADTFDVVFCSFRCTKQYIEQIT